MMVFLYLMSKLDINAKFERHKLQSVNLQSDVKLFLEGVSKTLNRSSDEIELIFLGKCLKQEDTLENCGVQPGMTIYAFPKHNIPTPAPKSTGPPNQAEIHQLFIALKTAQLNPSFHNTLQMLNKPEVMENIIAATPGLADDPVAQAILQDPEMLMLLADPAHVERVLELHPSLADAATPVAAAFHEETSSHRTSSNNATTSTAPPLISYSLDNLSDDDMDAQSDNALSFGGGLSSPSPITPNQLASALASVASGASGSRITGDSPSQFPASPGQLQTPPSTPRSFITSEMFSQAVQQALGVVTQPPTLQNQLQQLRDMGISNDATSLRALEMTGGDVHAALELIFGGLIDNENPNQSFA